MINEDIELSKLLFSQAEKHPELKAVTQNLSITTFRYIPLGYTEVNNNDYLNKLNEELLNILQSEGEVFVSNAIIKDNYCLRACIVNFRTSKKDIEEVVKIIVKVGRRIHKKEHI